MYPVLSQLIENDIPSFEEYIFTCKKIQSVEKSALTTNFSSVRNVNITNFPSIDNSEINGNYDSTDNEKVKHLIENDEAVSKDWKREKTFDGFPIYRVRTLFLCL